MVKRIICLLCAFCLFIPSAYAAKAKKPEPVAQSFDFDLTFFLNTEAFPLISRARAKGYADLLDSVGLRGNLSFCEEYDSIDLNASLFFLKKPDVSVDFRVYGTRKIICVSSPLLNDHAVYFNMAALMEYALKAKSNLNIPLPWFALLYPYATEYAMQGLLEVWEKEIGAVEVSRKIMPEQIDALGKGWDKKIQEDPNLIAWISGLTADSTAPDALEAEIGNVPFYPSQYVAAGGPVTVTVGEDNAFWQNAAGQVLYSSVRNGDDSSWIINLPATENRYQPFAAFTRSVDDSGVSLNFLASYARDTKEPAPAAEETPTAETAEVSAGESGEETAEYSGYSEGSDDSEEGGEFAGDDEEGGDAFPDELLRLSFSADHLPAELPADSSFTAAATVRGVILPDYTFLLQGTTKKDGSASLTLCKPRTGDAEPVRILTCEGTVKPVTPETTPRFKGRFFDEAFGFFAFNEEKLAEFKEAVLPSLIKGVISIAAETPASAFQSLLDDLTDAGILGVVLDN